MPVELFTALFILAMIISVARARQRIEELDHMPPSESRVSVRHLFIPAPGVRLTPATRRAASQYATQHGLDVLDMVPASMPVQHAWNLSQFVDPWRTQRERLTSGQTAGYALLVSADVAERAGLTGTPSTTAEFVRLAQRLKRYVGCQYGMAIAPELRTTGDDPYRDRAVLQAVLGAASRIVLLGTPAVVFGLGAAAYYAPVWGITALIIFQLQPALTVMGSPIKATGVLWSPLNRFWVELLACARLLRQPSPILKKKARADSLRPIYAQLLQEGTERFFSPRAETCPICEGSDLTVKLRVPDLLQHKPGTFTLEECGDCEHVFQNPRLNAEGLSFYYRDFYDGLGEDVMETIFGWGTQPYLDRANMVMDHAQPTRWLDVGCGHGHFGAVAQDVLPDTEFDGLDLSESVEDAARRRWIRRAYRGFFPALAPQLAEEYDTVSMSHYLEHTPDPWAEVEAAGTALRAGGHLMVEVPDPQSAFGRVLGRLWLPWFQPQHLHFLTVDNLTRMLDKQGFEVVQIDRAQAHIRVDILFATYLAMSRIAPPLYLPWRPRPGLWAKAKHALIWGHLWWLLPGAHAMDRALAPLLRRFGVSNTYRLLARKRPQSMLRAA